MSFVRLVGTALHAGVPVAATIVRRAGPLRFVQSGNEASLGDLRIARADHGVTLAGRGVRVDQVEHWLAALGGLDVREGITLEVEGPELPLLDGGARRWADALIELGAASLSSPEAGVRRSRPIITRTAEIGWGDSLYRFEPGRETKLEVKIVFDHPLIEVDRASWNGDPRDFAERIAPARTFGFARDREALLAAGRARGVDEESVVVFSESGVLSSGRPPTQDEAARHKLLDLIGDLAFYGGPFVGKMSAQRPGHRATHAIVADAIRTGVAVAAMGAAVLGSRPSSAAEPLLSPLADSSDPYALPDAPAPPTLPDLTHRGLSLALETSLARLQGNTSAVGGSTPHAFSGLERLEAEYAVALRRWYVGAAEELVIGAPPESGGTRFVASHPEVWGRAVWASQAGLAFGGGVGFVPPVVNHEPGSSADQVAQAVRVVRPWDYVVFADRALTLRPFFDVRDIDGALVLQIRQGIDWVSPTDSQATRVTSRTAIYLGYRIVDLIGVGLEAWEVYFVRAQGIDDHDRAAFALSPSVRVMKGWLQPALSVLFPIDRPLLSALDSYFAVRLNFSVVLEGFAPGRPATESPTVTPTPTVAPTATMNP